MEALRKIIKERIKLLVKEEKRNQYSPNRVHYVNEYEFLTDILSLLDKDSSLQEIADSIRVKQKAIRTFLNKNEKHQLASHFRDAKKTLEQLISNLQRLSTIQQEICR